MYHIVAWGLPFGWIDLANFEVWVALDPYFVCRIRGLPTPVLIQCNTMIYVWMNFYNPPKSLQILLGLPLSLYGL